jgi:hypothetical protein
MCVQVDIVASGAQRVIVNYKDSDNYLYGRYDFTNLKLEAWSRIAGVESLIRRVDAPQLADESPIIATVSFDRQKIVVQASTVNEELWDCIGHLVGGYYAALMSEGGGGIFDDFVLAQHDRTWLSVAGRSTCCYVCCGCYAGTDDKGFLTWKCISRALMITFSVTGDLVGSDLDGATIDLDNDLDVQCDGLIWDGGDTVCNEAWAFELECKGTYPRMDLDDWTLNFTGIGDNYCVGSIVGQTPTSTQCSPLQLVWGPFTVANADPPLPGEYCDCLPTPGSGTYTATVTERP